MNWYCIVLELLTLIVLGVSAYLFYRQMQSNHEWNRHRTAHDLIFQSYMGHFSDLRRHLEHKINIYDEKQTYEDKKNELNDADHKNLNAILNYLENVCLAVKNNVVTESIIFDCLAEILIAYRRWASPYVCKIRAYHPRAWIEIDPFVKEWSEQRDKIVSKIVRKGCEKL